MKKIIVVIIIFVFLSGCATVQKQKQEIRTNQFQNMLGFIIAGAGLASGAYIGYQAADKNNQGESFSYGLIGGLLGGLLSGGAYYIAMQFIAEKIDVSDSIEEPKTDETILMPK
jgi:uncharacterized protein YceK